jgi:DNA excision repair protein ERCC-1
MDQGIQASSRQSGNPILRSVRRVKVELSSKFPELDLFDFVVNSQLRIPVLFLSLKFHATYQEYLLNRVLLVSNHQSSGPAAPVLLCLVDIEDPGSVENHLEQITVLSVLHGLRLLLAWTADEAARILEILHVFGPDRASDIARGVIGTGMTSSNNEVLLAQAKEAIQTVQGGVGQKDSTNLLANFGSIKSIILASQEALTLCPSIGPKKSRHLFEIFNSNW